MLNMSNQFCLSKWKISRIFLIISLLFLCSMKFADAATNKNLWPFWQANNPLSQKTISHKEWQQFLNNNVRTNKEQINLVDYENLSDHDATLLKQYLQRMSSIKINEYNRDEQLAYWLNLYNAITVNIVRKYYPVSSIKNINISPGLFSIGPWGTHLIKVLDTPLSLDDIHNRIIRPIWNDARTHYAINNATLGAPNLRKKAYQGSTIHEQLNQAATDYINSLRGVQVIEGKLFVSKIYEWFAEDFGSSQHAIICHLGIFSKKLLREKLKHVNRIDGYMYNWHLNALVPKKP